MEKSKTNKTKTENNSYSIGIRLILFSILSIVIYLIPITILWNKGEIFFFDGNFDWDHSGALGSYMNGIIGTFFSIIASILIYSTYSSQQREFRLSKEKENELRQRDQNKEFDSKFHSLLNLLNSIVNNIEVNEYHTSKIERFNNVKRYKCTRQLRGRDAFEFYYYILHEEFNDRIKAKGTTNFYDDDTLKEVWNIFYKVTGSNKLRSYFKTLIFIIQLIETNKNDVENIGTYSELLYCQFCQYELWILFFYSMEGEKTIISNNTFLTDYTDKQNLCTNKNRYFIEH